MKLSDNLTVNKSDIVYLGNIYQKYLMILDEKNDKMFQI